MLFSAYQIESLLEEYQPDIFNMDKSVSDTLSLSENAVQDSRHYFGTAKKSASDWISPKDIRALVEDQTTYDPIVDYVQQSRAGRFVVPVFVPKIPAPAFPLVTDHTQAVRKSDAEKREFTESSIPEKDDLQTELSTESASIEDKVSVTDIEVEDVETRPDETAISATDQSPAEESTEREPEPETEKTKISQTEKAPVSAASLFEGIDTDDQDEEFDFDTGGLIGELEDDSDVVFGDGRIELKSMIKFVGNYPDSTIKLLLRKNLDGRPLPNGYEEIYLSWETRGLSRGRLKKYLFKLMEWNDFPDLPVLDVVRIIRERHYDLKEKKE